MCVCACVNCDWMLLLLVQMAQELGVIEKEPNFINPYKIESYWKVMHLVSTFSLVAHYVLLQVNIDCLLRLWQWL